MIEVPLPEATIKKRRLVLQSLVESKKANLKSLLKHLSELGNLYNAPRVSLHNSISFAMQVSTHSTPPKQLESLSLLLTSPSRRLAL